MGHPELSALDMYWWWRQDDGRRGCTVCTAPKIYAVCPACYGCVHAHCRRSLEEDCISCADEVAHGP